jgi:hypothetical protein
VSKSRAERHIALETMRKKLESGKERQARGSGLRPRYTHASQSGLELEVHELQLLLVTGHPKDNEVCPRASKDNAFKFVPHLSPSMTALSLPRQERPLKGDNRDILCKMPQQDRLPNYHYYKTPLVITAVSSRLVLWFTWESL